MKHLTTYFCAVAFLLACRTETDLGLSSEPDASLGGSSGTPSTNGGSSGTPSTSGGTGSEAGQGGVAPSAGTGGEASAGEGGTATAGTGGEPARCDEIASCAGEPGPCVTAVDSYGTVCAIGSYTCNGKTGFYSDDGLDYPCDDLPDAGVDCGQASAEVTAHCDPLCSCPAGPAHGFYTCPSGSLTCKLYCFDGYLPSGDACVEPPPDPCWETCAQGGYCSNGACVPCPNPTMQIDCDHKASNGCEQPFDAFNCGACGVKCDLNQFCSTDTPGGPFSCH